ncbi:HNH endonuclease [Streptomyces sp. NPDC005407]|uniref:HNH endonuclease n=1 Tax=Streptomyces sp. NPDC005407 TaxID=3155340 RepID=UPI00339DFB3E
MIRITRPRLPSELETALLKLTDELAGTPVPERRKHVNRMWKRETFRRDVYTPVREALEGMTPGYDCCMYCGDHLADTIDHLVPKAVCALRTFYWPNLLLACSPCNSRYKGDQHEGDGLLGSLLVDPTRENPFDHLTLWLDSGVYRPVEGSSKGEWTIKVCGLNEGKRSRVRAAAWVKIGGHLRAWDRARSERNEKDMRFAVYCIRDQPFADVYYAALHHVDAGDAQNIFAETNPDVLALLRDDQLREALLA